MREGHGCEAVAYPVLFQELLRFISCIVWATISCDGLWNAEVVAELSQHVDKGQSSSSIPVHLEPVGEPVDDDAVVVASQVHVVSANMLKGILGDDRIYWGHIGLAWGGLVA